MKCRGWLLLTVAVAGLSGCSMTFDATRLGVPVTMASSAAAPAQGDHFKLTSHAG